MTTPKAGRPRDVDRDRALLVATGDLLAEVGYDRLTIDAVAGRCSAGKATVYRRWPSKAELVADAVALLHDSYDAPDTGDLREDLIAMAEQWHDLDARRDAVIAGLLTAMAHDEPLRTAVQTAISQPRHACYRAVVDRAIADGQLSPDLDVDLIGAVFPALTFHQITVRAEPVDRSLIERIVDHLVLPALTRPNAP
ncbi:TetR/AcrR family transcriptional regulator [Gordonia alkaliphila]|uniref:TetR/AcrR family transcriptional regulator n=1 Tax=Gordonia alkaliphila TaxID=1053547 RepID=A0ABP8Z3G5_9ACTN